MPTLAGLASRLPKPVRRFLKSVPGATRVRDALYRSPQGDPYPPGSPRPVVYLPTWLEWDVMRQRPQYLLEAFANAGHDVYFVDPRHVGDDRRLGRVVLTSTLESTPAAHSIIYTHFAPTRTMLDRYQDPVVIYDILDDLTIYDPDEVGFPPERTVRYHHVPLMSDACVVIVSNPVLEERHRPERPDLILVENGVDADLFTVDGERIELGEKPVVGFHGAIREWVDLAMVESVANARPEYTFVLVGPPNEAVEEAMARLGALENVVVVPEKPSAEVAAYVRSFTVGTVPFEVNTMTQGVTPIKLYEYLASGVPVVASPLPSCVAHPLVAVADDVESWVRALDEAVAISDTERARLRHAGLEASWDRRMEPLLDRLDREGLRYVPGS